MPKQDAEKKSNAFGWIVGGAVVAISIVIGALFVNALETEGQATGDAFPTSSAGMGQPLVVGEADAPNVVSIFEDYQCPFCKGFEDYFSNVLTDAISAGKTKVEYYPVAFLGEGSSIASNAAACAADQGKFHEYHQALFIHQPDETSGRPFDETLITSLAKSALMPDQSAFDKCVADKRYSSWVESLLKVMEDRKVSSTPTVFVNGKKFDFKTTSQLDMAEALGLVAPQPASKNDTGN